MTDANSDGTGDVVPQAAPGKRPSRPEEAVLDMDVPTWTVRPVRAR